PGRGAGRCGLAVGNRRVGRGRAKPDTAPVFPGPGGPAAGGSGRPSFPGPVPAVPAAPPGTSAGPASAGQGSGGPASGGPASSVPASAGQGPPVQAAGDRGSGGQALGGQALGGQGDSGRAITVLHLSDTHFGAHHGFGTTGLTAADRAQSSLFGRLHEDLAALAETEGLRPDLVVVAGDLAETGAESEFDQAYDFLVALAGA